MVHALFPVASNSSKLLALQSVKTEWKCNSWSFRSLKGRTDVVKLMVTMAP
jgi:hypothetical protein